MALVAELYGEYRMRDLSRSERELVWTEGERRLNEKIQLFKANPRISFSDFGTRRRFSRRWHEHVVARLAEEFPNESVFVDNPQFRGTSNT